MHLQFDTNTDISYVTAQLLLLLLILLQACLVHQSLSGQVPAHLTDDINLVADSGHSRLRSAVDKTCVVPRARNMYGNKSFTAEGLHV